MTSTQWEYSVCGTVPCTQKHLVLSNFNSAPHFFFFFFLERWLWPKATAQCGLARWQSADRWFLSVAVNRPLVGGLTPVTLPVYNSRLPSHSPGQLRNFSQKSDEQVAGPTWEADGHARCKKTVVLPLSPLPSPLFPPLSLLMAAWEKTCLAKERKPNKIMSHASSICPASWRPLPVIIEMSHLRLGL